MTENDKRIGRLPLIDVTALARELFGEEGAEYVAGQPLPVTDWRFEIRYIGPGGLVGKATFPRHATAEQVAASLARDNIELEGRSQ